MTAVKLWTPEDDTRLHKLVLAGRSAEEVAIELNRSVGSVRARVKKLGIVFGMSRYKKR